MFAKAVLIVDRSIHTNISINNLDKQCALTEEALFIGNNNNNTSIKK